MKKEIIKLLKNKPLLLEKELLIGGFYIWGIRGDRKVGIEAEDELLQIDSILQVLTANGRWIEAKSDMIEGIYNHLISLDENLLSRNLG